MHLISTFLVVCSYVLGFALSSPLAEPMAEPFSNSGPRGGAKDQNKGKDGNCSSQPPIQAAANM
jgi:hypothetical protein